MQKYFDNHKVKGAFIGALLCIILFIFESKFGFPGARKASNILFTIVVLGAGLSAYSFGISAPNKYTFGNIFAHAFKSIGVAIIMVTAFYILDHFLFHPNFKDEALAEFQKQIDEVPITEMDADKKLEQIKAYKNNFLVMARISPSLLFFGALGALGSLLGAGFSPKKD
jgi:purine-cytosine permease-like protein